MKRLFSILTKKSLFYQLRLGYLIVGARFVSSIGKRGVGWDLQMFDAFEV
jgi:hypothetical protein